LDQGFDNAYLQNPHVAALIQDTLLLFDGERYKLSAWVIMPNHMHLLLKPIEGHTLSGILHSLKSYTASEANKLLNRKGKFWMEDYFGRYIRNAEHFARTVVYIESNPVKARLCKEPSEWRFSSAWMRAHKEVN